ncbi:hypothetical protein [Brevibacillus migulae]|uniref:hypothetical protein n=1 Tax=Brevibacillus migulae TaxID=1644114 RepID=UPI00106E9C1E|nr:hypothetical protein [Brevibacillus migulae]
MEKKKYYLSIHSSPNTWEVREGGEDSTFDFEIEATPDEKKQLEDLFTSANDDDFRSYLHGHLLFTDVEDQDHEAYDHTLNELYHKIYEFGTPETKQKMEQMGIIDALKGHLS